jgi:hypothetical protein
MSRVILREINLIILYQPHFRFRRCIQYDSVNYYFSHDTFSSGMQKGFAEVY